MSTAACDGNHKIVEEKDQPQTNLLRWEQQSSEEEAWSQLMVAAESAPKTMRLHGKIIKAP